MMKKGALVILILLFALGFMAPGVGNILAAEPDSADAQAFPRSLENYDDAETDSIWAILKNRVKQEPFNLIATLIFFLAIIQ